MGILVLLFGVIPNLILSFCMEQFDNAEPAVNVSDFSKDMYVINAMVYQIGIVTNKTDNDTSNMNTGGNQESLTYYHNNGSTMNLSGIPPALRTNVTAQSFVGIASLPGSNDTTVLQSALQHLVAGGAQSDPKIDHETLKLSKTLPRHVRDETNVMDNADDSSGVYYNKIFKRGATNGTTVQLVKGSAVIPEAAGLRSIAIPALLTLNNNFSDIPVPIPNTSVVHYAKINTIVSTP